MRKREIGKVKSCRNRNRERERERERERMRDLLRKTEIDRQIDIIEKQRGKVDE